MPKRNTFQQMATKKKCPKCKSTLLKVDNEKHNIHCYDCGHLQAFDRTGKFLESGFWPPENWPVYEYQIIKNGVFVTVEKSQIIADLYRLGRVNRAAFRIIDFKGREVAGF